MRYNTFNHLPKVEKGKEVKNQIVEKKYAEKENSEKKLNDAILAYFNRGLIFPRLPVESERVEEKMK